MKINELFNNYPNLYFNVLPARNTKPTGNMIAAVMRAQADEMGTDSSGEYPETSDEHPNSKYDRRQYDDVGKSIVQRIKQLKKKQTAKGPKEIDFVGDGNAQASVIYR